VAKLIQETVSNKQTQSTNICFVKRTGGLCVISLKKRSYRHNIKANPSEIHDIFTKQKNAFENSSAPKVFFGGWGGGGGYTVTI
jgi:hypothetical protein